MALPFRLGFPDACCMYPPSPPFTPAHVRFETFRGLQVLGVGDGYCHSGNNNAECGEKCCHAYEFRGRRAIVWTI